MSRTRRPKVSSFTTAPVEDVKAEVLATPAPQTLAATFGTTWEHLTLEIERHISLRDIARQAAEDERAVRRNRNRMMTLLGALMIGLVVTYMTLHGALPKSWAPYSFVITVMLDSTLAAYSWIRRY